MVMAQEVLILGFKVFAMAPQALVLRFKVLVLRFQVLITRLPHSEIMLHWIEIHLSRQLEYRRDTDSVILV